MPQNIRKLIFNILAEEAGNNVPFSVERSEVEARGDYSSNIALARAKKEKRPPMDIAHDIATRIKEKHPDTLHVVEVAPPGFLNFYLEQSFLYKSVDDFLRPAKKKSLRRASVEFISANPTGPLHVGNARGGPIGDVIANLLERQGYKVTREYYHNDAGAQVGKFADSLWYWYLRARRIKVALPEDGYEGEYVRRIGIDACNKWKGKLLDDPKGEEKLVKLALARFWQENFETIKKMGITFDRITKESALARSKTKKVLAELNSKGLLKKREGATWFTPHEDLEAVVVKTDGTPIYFAHDIAYHKEKFSKNDLVVDVLGEGHEGHIPKLRAVADVYEFPQEKFKIVIHGQVNLLKKGAVVTMSKRKGNFVTAEEVLKEVGRDAFRFFMLQYSPRTGMQFDLSLAKEQSKKNPVYYVQYAHARASSILSKGNPWIEHKKTNWSMLETMPELNLIKQILAFPEVVEETSKDFQLQRLTRYAYELARTFTHFYETTKVVGVPKEFEAARLALVSLTRDTLRNISKLLGISTPEKM